MSSADCWITNHAHKSPAFVLAMNGYDVWLGNNRGGLYSRRHVNLDPDVDTEEFFNYSFVELGKYDLPAMLDFVRRVTNVEKVTYIAHSQGTTQMFFALAEMQEQMAERINLFIALGPVVTLNHARDGLLGTISENQKLILTAMKYFQTFELLGQSWNNASAEFCLANPVLCNHLSYQYMSAQTAFND